VPPRSRDMHGNGRESGGALRLLDESGCQACAGIPPWWRATSPRRDRPAEDWRARPAIRRSMSFCDTCVAPRCSNGPTGRQRLTGAEALELEGMDPCYIDIYGFGPKDADSKGPESAPIAN
jgi:hypothetical protein